jgi:hypothetical protein
VSALTKMMKPNRKQLGTLWAGTSGSGKTTAILSTLREAILSPSFGEKHRFVIIDPKIQGGDYDRLADPETDLNTFLDGIRTERVSLYWPSYEQFDERILEADIAMTIDELFRLADSDPKATFTFVLDEASIVISPHSLSPSLKRLSVQGRAKRILPVFVSQRPLTNRWLDANLSNLILFRINIVDADNLTKRWGVDFVQNDEKIRGKPYSFARFSLETNGMTYYNPVPYPTPKIVRKKKSAFQKFKSQFGF